ncbi:MAG: acyltransferase [Hellea sp.]|nr:acyltransferase [Hellea sp.]
MNALDTHNITPRSEYGYIPGLDGLRAVAVWIVLFAHLGWSHIIPGGFGVTVFFFISGFLITRLLLAEREKKGRIKLGDFYIRRFLRLIPALFVMLIISGAAMLALGKAIPLWEAVSAFTYTMNYQFAYLGFTGAGPGTPWDHLWSLAVEEHFYLLFPLLLIFAKADYAKALKIGLGICAAALAWRFIAIFGLKFPWQYTYAATETRLDNILYGCLLSLGLHVAPSHRFWGWIKGIAPVALAGAALMSTFLIREEWYRETLRYTIQGMSLFVLVFNLMFFRPMSIFVKFLELKPMRWMGQISYGLYLWHVPFTFLAADHLGIAKASLPFVAFVLIGTFAMTCASYYWIEQPVVKLRKRFGSHTREDGKKIEAEKSAGSAIPAPAE